MRRHRSARSIVWTCRALGFIVVSMDAAVALAADAADFNRSVAPILIKRCVECHSGANPTGGLNITTLQGIKTGGESGPALVAGKPDESHLLERVAGGEMPPAKQGKSMALPAAEVATLRAWIAAGAAWPSGRVLDLYEATTDKRGGRDWWSLQPIRRPEVPIVAAADRIHPTPVDAFLLAKLQARGWRFAPPADKRTLLRRITIALTGLPPTLDEIDAFMADDRTDAYDRLIERLLASPHYGERWGRFWLDVARYAETCGYERDQVLPNAWKYRDWVIRAFNNDMPFDQFVIEQLAGDELPGRNEQSVIATGFLRLGTWNDEPNDPQEYKYERLEDLVHTTSTAFLGLTVKCARCHDHKFDPVPQRDYHRVAAAFWAGPIEPGPRELLGGPEAKRLGYDVLGWTDVSTKPAPFPLLKKGDPRRPGPPVDPGVLSAIVALDRPTAAPPTNANTTTRRLQLAKWIADARNPLTARVWVNRVWQHHFGAGLVHSPDNFGFTGDKPTHPELLDWLADELIRSGWSTKHIHRLLLRSQAYRQASIHPNEAEYASADAGNRLWWRAQRRRLDAEALRDALLAVAGRLDPRVGGPSFAPQIERDALEGLSMKANAYKPSPESEQRRRSVYIFSKRGLLPPLLTTFDLCDTTLPCGQRDVSVVAPQALTLLNNAFIHEQSAALAQRVIAAITPPLNKRGPITPPLCKGGQGGVPPERAPSQSAPAATPSLSPESAKQRAAQVRLAWRFALGRQPTAAELSAALEHLEQQTRHFGAKSTESHQRALASLCHVLVNTNEFVYVD